MQLTPPGHDKGVAIAGKLDPQCHVVLQLALKPIANLPARDVLTLTPSQRARVHHEFHRQGRLIDLQQGQAFGRVERADGGPDIDRVDPGHGANIPRKRFVHRDPLQPFVTQHLVDFAVHRLGAWAVDHGHRLTRADLAAVHTPDADSTDITRPVQ